MSINRAAAVGLVAALYGCFFALPLVLFLFGKTELGLFLTDPYLSIDIARTLLFTVIQAFLSAAISVLLALPGAYFISHIRFPLRRLVQSISLVPFVLPSIIVIICMISFYGNSGVLSRLLNLKTNVIYNFTGILLAHVFYNYAIALRIIGEGWSGISPRYNETAKSLGDSGVGVFFNTVCRYVGRHEPKANPDI